MENDNPLLLGMDLPYSMEAEQSVLGAVLVEPGCLSELVERLRPDSFYRPQHKALFNEMVRMFTSGEPVDFITLLEAAKEEAALFAGSLYRMYSMYAESIGWKTELMSAGETELGGYREISFMVTGDGAYSKLKFESGVHRVQRVPETETQGRIHTSTVTVAVLPEVEDIEIEVRPEDLQVETCKSSGAGGQHINKTESAIRIIHKPSGLVIECQEERSQHKNREKAMKMLRAKLYDIEKTKQDNAIANERKSQVGTGDRSQKIRTYNFPQSRVTDHRIGFTTHNFDGFLDGDIDEMIMALMAADTAEKLKGSAENAN